jgi:hypothetical protein
MHSVAAKVPIKILVRLQNRHAQADTRQQQTKHQSGGSRADDAAIEVMLGHFGHASSPDVTLNPAGGGHGGR